MARYNTNKACRSNTEQPVSTPTWKPRLIVTHAKTYDVNKDELTGAQVYGEVHGRVRREERLIRVSHEAAGVHGTAVGVGRAAIDVPHRDVEALRATAFPDRLDALSRRVYAAARGRRGEPGDARHGRREVGDKRPRRAREAAGVHGGAVADLRVARERGLVEEGRALVPEHAAVEDGAPAVGGGAAGGAEARGGRVEAGDAVAARDVRAALRHRERRGGGARLRGGGEAAAARRGEVGAEAGECGVEGGDEGGRGRGIVLAAPQVEQRGLRVAEGERGPRGRDYQG